MEPVHRSVLLDEVLEALALDGPEGVLVDGTLGEGGHSVSFLQRFPLARIIGVDADRQMLDRARQRIGEGAPVTFVNSWFDDYFADATVRFDRILLDLGVSMYHFSLSGRGFSFRSDEPLDMRLSLDAETSAADLVNNQRESDLADLIYQFGEERYSRRIASSIVRARAARPLRTTKELAEVVWAAVPPAYRHGRIHPATRTFQALRIAVNGELDRISRGLPAALDRLQSSGRCAVISFHSLEDRIVKHLFRDYAQTRGYTVLTRKPIVPSDDEIRSNPAARSAKLRVIERTGGDA
ncbi:MAG: 16S rRNA (cytosine(1402)-N(4))-methyltransferase [Spirochaetaceae bacterium]|nr:MAG: 16S rRNA (cytosine(1402)-N(4))-methyltransferase [Spirochaetaceae bacterium]